MKTAVIAIIAVAIIAVAGTGTVLVLGNDDGDDRDTITVTMSWEKEIVEDIVGDDYRVVSMMGSNVSPHEAYSTPSNISDLYDSVLYFKIGSGVEWETAFMDAVSSQIPSTVKVVDIASSITYAPLPNTHHHHGGEDANEEEGAYDAHIWTSPDILRNIAKLVCEQVSALNPDKASDYSDNLADFNGEAAELDSKMSEIAELVGSTHTHVMVWHPAWQYLLGQYAERFGTELHQESVEEDGEVSPAEAADIVKNEGCTSIYVSTTDEGYEGRAALEEAGITVHVVNPTGDDMLDEIENFLEYLYEDLKA